MKKEAKTCWDYWDCQHTRKCPEAKYSTGKRCWELAGTGCRDEFCFLLMSRKGKYRFCWECEWFKLQNPEFYKKEE